jgi:hypothetical protein
MKSSIMSLTTAQDLKPNFTLKVVDSSGLSFLTSRVENTKAGNSKPLLALSLDEALTISQDT